MSNYCPSEYNPFDECEICPTCGLLDISWGDDFDEDTCLVTVEDPYQHDVVFCSPSCKELYLAGVMWQWHGDDPSQRLVWRDTGKDVTDPYGSLNWCVGTDDDFICLEVVQVSRYLILHSVVNSETGGFIDNFHYSVKLFNPNTIGSDVAGLVSGAIGWCQDNDIQTDFDAFTFKGIGLIVDLLDKNTNTQEF